MALPISEEIQATRPAPIGLGSLIEQFPLHRRSYYYLSNLFAAIFFLLLSASLIGVGLILSCSAYDQYGPQVIWKTIQDPMIAGLAGGILGVFLLVRALQSRHESVEIYEHGLIWIRHRSYHSFFWKDINSTLVRSTQSSFGLKLQRQLTWCRLSAQSKDLILDNRFGQIESLVNRIQKAVYPVLYMKYAQLYNQGVLLDFGAIQLDKSGIILHRSKYTWEAIAPGAIQSGYLEFPVLINGRLVTQRTSTGQIENLDVLVAILNYILKWS